MHIRCDNSCNVDWLALKRAVWFRVETVVSKFVLHHRRLAFCNRIIPSRLKEGRPCLVACSLWMAVLLNLVNFFMAVLFEQLINIA